MKAGLELFATEGYHPSSISTIAKRAGISKGLMYNYFDSKEALLRSIMLDGLNTLTMGFDPDRDGVLTNQELIHFIRESVSMVKAHPDYWKLYFVVIYQSPATTLFHDELIRAVNGYLTILERYFASRGVKNAAAEARLFTSILDGVCVNFLHDQTNFPMDLIEKRLIEMYS
jgi:AcrR family transcriptional regulator